MRKILFKAQRVDGKGWVEGYYYLDKEYNTHYLMNELESTEVIPETVCQYTGLNDKNGKRIFENDFDQNFDVVKWCENRIGYSLFTYDHPTKEFIHCNCYCCSGNFELNEVLEGIEIIGNTHDKN